MCNHSNLRLFEAQPRIISHQRSGLFMRVWRTYGGCMYVVHSLGFGTRVGVTLAQARILLLYAFVHNLMLPYI